MLKINKLQPFQIANRFLCHLKNRELFSKLLESYYSPINKRNGISLFDKNINKIRQIVIEFSLNPSTCTLIQIKLMFTDLLNSTFAIRRFDFALH